MNAPDGLGVGGRQGAVHGGRAGVRDSQGDAPCGRAAHHVHGEDGQVVLQARVQHAVQHLHRHATLWIAT